jgi:hypothetical protein
MGGDHIETGVDDDRDMETKRLNAASDLPNLPPAIQAGSFGSVCSASIGRLTTCKRVAVATPLPAADRFGVIRRRSLQAR